MKTCEDIIIGGLYKAHPDKVGATRTSGYEQNYGLFIPFVEEETNKIWMIDTYHIDSPAIKKTWPGESREEKFINGFLADSLPHSRYFIHETIYDCYYNACVVLSPANCEQFEFLGNLTEYIPISYSEARKYKAEDLIENVRLWREHAYPNGVILVRKDASISSCLELDAEIDDLLSSMTRPYVKAGFAHIEELYDKLEGIYDPVKFRAVKHLYEKMREMQEEWMSYERDVRMLRKMDIDAFDTWESGVPASDICA